MTKKIICIGAHPDDIEIGCGATIKKYALQGSEIYFLIGSTGNEVKIKNKNWKSIMKQRSKESLDSAKYLSIKEVFFLGFADTFIQHNGDTIKSIENYIFSIKPEIIFTHTVRDHHQDHKNLALSTLSACRREKINVLHYETPSTAQEFSPTVYSDITQTIEAKISAIKLFLTQEEKVYVNPDAIKGLAKYRGFTSGSAYAEAFEVSKYFL
jgi:LmbE family N-acetylglucosaminyl deacetylase